MEAVKEARNGRSLLILRGNITVYQVPVLKPLLMEALAECDVLEISLGGVTELDSSALQVLMWVQREAASQGKALKLTDLSPEVLEMFEAHRLSEYFAMARDDGGYEGVGQGFCHA